MARDPSDLSAYLDGELSREASREAEAWMREDPESARELKQLERSRAMFAQCIDRPAFHANLMRRVYGIESGTRNRRYAAGSLLAAAAAVLLLVLGALLALEQWRNADHAAPGITKSVSPVVAPQPSGPSSTATGPKLAAGAVTEATTAPPPLESTKLPLVLMGTITGENPLAVIDVKEGPKQGPQVFQKGEAVLDGVTVVEIKQDEVVLDNKGQPATLTRVEDAAPANVPDLSGTWIVRLIVGGQDARTIGEVRLEQSGSTVKLYDGADLAGEGRLSGSNAQFTPTQPPFNTLGAIYGGFNSEWNQFTAPLTNLSPQALDALGLAQAEPVPEYIALRLDRVSGSNVNSKLTEEARLLEVQRMVQQLVRFASAHEGQFPAKLDDLVPSYVPDLSIFANSNTRTVQYIPGLKSPNAILEATKDLRNLDTSLPYPDALMKCEQVLRDAGLGEFLFPRTILKVTYTNPDAVVMGTTTGMACPVPSASSLSDPVALGEMRAGCQNNLKQFGLVIKMFENDNHEYTPPGWLYVFPEYLADASMVTSPKDEPSTDSYLLLCPATNIKEYISQTHGELDPAAWGQVYAGIPVAMNRTDFPDPAGRNVLFADGHVAFIRAPQIPPLLDFWSQRQ